MIPSLARLAANTTRQAAKDALRARSLTPSYPVLQKCPSPTCECAEMPAGLDIEREKPLNGTMAAHAEQLLIASGQADWSSKIEDEKETAPWGEFAFNVKSLLGRDGEYHDPYHNVSVSTCSFEVPANSKSERSARAFLFPSFKVVEEINTERWSVADFVKTFLLPTKLHAQHDSLPKEERRRRTRDTGNTNSTQWAGKVHPVTAPTIMICSHNSRDSRCGILGPLLHAEFTQYVNKRHTLRNQSTSHDGSDSSAGAKDMRARTFASHPEFRPDVIDQEKDGMHPINIGMLSHMGGHKWAGNVIIYIPPDYHCNPVERVRRGAKPKNEGVGGTPEMVHEDERKDEILESNISPLAGKSIWYGRVEPQHVEGIVEETIGHGQIIGELFRGGVNADGSYIRI